MRLGRDGTKTHRAGAETLYDLAGRLHFLNRNRATIGTLFEFHQPAQRTSCLGVLVDVIGKLFIGIKIVRARSGLKRSDGIRIPHVLLALSAPVEFAQIGQRFHLVFLAFRKTQRVTTQHFFCKHIKIHSLHTASGPHKAQVNHFILQTDRLKDLRTLVRMQCGDSHFGHDLEHAFGNTFTIGRHERSVIRKLFRITKTFTSRFP